MNFFQTEQVRKKGFLTVTFHILAVALTALMLFNYLPSAGAADSYPVYVSESSPDLPFEEYTNGKIGIVRPSFGRKTLFIAYRYLNGGSFTAEEQSDLVEALNGTAPEENALEALKAWIDARKEFVREDQKLPQIYTERTYGGYDFFPNCAKNAFEVALQTLKDRAASYGADDKDLRAWLAAQDLVFANCSTGSQIPGELGAESEMWLRKDRDYQIAAAHFYSLNFDEARSRFEKIARDVDSPWQEIAGYLVARTLIRQGSLSADVKKKRELFEKAETVLQPLTMSGGKYAGASRRLLGLVRYHIRPEERVVELSRILATGSTEDLRQDLIDFVWLLDKIEAQISKAEEERKKKSEGTEEVELPYAPSKESQEKRERFERGESIEITFYAKATEGNQEYVPGTSIEFKHDVPEAEILGAFEQKLNRKLTAEETERIKEIHKDELTARQYRMSPNRRWAFGGLSHYEGCFYFECAKFTLDLLPDFLRSNDLSDWILTLQTRDPRAYNHALSKWQETSSPAWLITALVKAEKSSPGLRRLMRAAERVARDDPAFPTVVYHRIRLKAAMGQTDEARQLVDEIISWQSGVLPVSAQNQFLELRMHLSRDLSEFLKSAQWKPVVFYDYGTYGKLSDMLKIEKSHWNPSYMQQTKEEYEQELDESYKALMPWEDRFGFDERTLDIFDWHFPVQLLAEAARNPNVPVYQQRNLVLATWTRAILLKNDEIARRIAPEVVKVEPEIATVFEQYLKARTAKERSYAALYILLKFPRLSPFVQGGLPRFDTSEGVEYYFEDSWWCKPLDTEYIDDKEVPKVVPRPDFLTAAQLETARREYATLIATEDAKSYLGKQVIEWARSSPDDPRIPEALFITFRANTRYKYGCNGWEHDEKTYEEAETLLRQRYPESPWTAKLDEDKGR